MASVSKNINLHKVAAATVYAMYGYGVYWYISSGRNKSANILKEFRAQESLQSQKQANTIDITKAQRVISEKTLAEGKMM